MNAILRLGGKPIADIEVEEGSHIFLKNADGQEIYLEWKDAPETMRREAVASLTRLQEAFSEASESLWTLLPSRDNVVELWAIKARKKG